MGSFHVSLFAILSRPSSPPPLSRRRRRHRCALCVFLHFSTANAHFFFFPASVELSKRSESNGSSLKFFFTMVAQTNNENARSLVLRAFFARRIRAERGACVVPFVLKLNPRERARSAHEFPGLTSKTLVLILFEYRKPFPIQYRVAHYEV